MFPGWNGRNIPVERGKGSHRELETILGKDGTHFSVGEMFPKVHRKHFLVNMGDFWETLADEKLL